MYASIYFNIVCINMHEKTDTLCIQHISTLSVLLWESFMYKEMHYAHQ